MTSPIILIADDNDDDVLLLKRALQVAAIQNPVRIVRNGEETIQYLNGERDYSNRARYPYPILLILNLQMPRKNGGEVLAWLSTQPTLPRIKLVVLTGTMDPRQTTQAVHLGAEIFLPKPPDAGRFVQLLREMKDVRLIPVENGCVLQWSDASG